MSIADAEAMAAKVFPDPELGFEAGNEIVFRLGAFLFIGIRK